MRKGIILLFNLIFLSAYFSVAQSVDQPKNIATSIRVSIADTTHNLFLSEQKKLKEIWGVFRGDELHEVRLRYQKQDNEFWDSEYYDMNFEGDAFVFNKKYKNQIHFKNPKIDIQEIYGKKLSCDNRELRTIIRQDSVIFDFRVTCESDGVRSDIPIRTELGVPAKYSGDFEKLRLRIEKLVADIDPAADIDSTVVFRGVIDVDGSVSSLVLEAGERSAFSDVVNDAWNSSQGTEALSERQLWIPARIERGFVKSNIRIYARLNKEGSIKMSTTRLLGTLSVWE